MARALRHCRSSLSGVASERRLRVLLEIGLYFVLAEGLLRKVFPQHSTLILAFKFVYFAGLYAVAGAVLSRQTAIRMPVFLSLYLCWGTLVTWLHVTRNPLTATLGLLINLAFVPVLLLSARLYNDAALRQALFRRLTLFAGFAGCIAICQSFLSPTHWLNLEMDGITVADDHRVSATFQYCTVFGNYAIGGAIACMGSLFRTTRQSLVMPLVSLSLLGVGVLFSGSRTGVVGCFLVVVLIVLLNKPKMSQLCVVGLVGIVLFTWFSVSGFSSIATLRAVSFNDVSPRVQGEYLGWLTRAMALSHGPGLGWGPFTMGVSAYAARLGYTEWPAFLFREIEGGYAYVVAGTGAVGLLFFLAMHAGFLPITKAGGETRWLAPAVVLWSLFGNIALCLQEVPELAVYWWFLVGVSLGVRAHARVLRRHVGISACPQLRAPDERGLPAFHSM